METKVEKPTIERIGRKMQFANIFLLPHLNRGGGLALLWKAKISVYVQTYSNRHIDAIIDHGVNDTWRLMVSMETRILPVRKTLNLYLDL